MTSIDPRLIQMLPYARVPFALNVEPDESVLIVADTETDAICWQAVAAAGHAHGAKITVTLSPPPEQHSYEPVAAVAAAMWASDHVMLLTSRALAHSDAAKRCQREGRTIFFMEEITPEMLLRGALLEDYEAMQDLGTRVMNAWTEARDVRVTTAEGTDLTCSVEGREGLFIAGKAFKSDTLEMCCAAFPDGEAVIAPVEGSANGTVVFDTTAHGVGRIKEPMRLTITDGVIAAIEGRDEARTWERILEAQNDPESWNFPAEIAIGLNPKTVITGVLREDKKIWGSCHMACGTNIDFGGTVKAKIHMDGLMLKPTVVFDGNEIVKDGRIVI
jgi:2,5-dihydroxypyridine 5,6-dioxygenase